ncbi:hypothetical protein CHUAL_014136 [Chamberlinius hualienensis]
MDETKKCRIKRYVCAVGTCEQTRTENGIAFHRFPVDPARQKMWISRCRRKDPINVINGRICSRHFLPEHYREDKVNIALGLQPRMCLTRDAIPTLYLSKSKSLHRELATKSISSPRSERLEKRNNKKYIDEILQTKTESDRTESDVSDKIESKTTQANEQVQPQVVIENVASHNKSTPSKILNLGADEVRDDRDEKIIELQEKVIELQKEVAMLKEQQAAYNHLLAPKQIDIINHCRKSPQWIIEISKVNG